MPKKSVEGTTSHEARVVSDTGEWAKLVVETLNRKGGTLPTVTVIVPDEAIAHALRKEIFRLSGAKAVAGARFVTSTAAAREVLLEAGIDFTDGEDAIRPARMTALMGSGAIRFERLGDLIEKDPEGWRRALARTIGDLERAGLKPADLAKKKAETRAASMLAEIAALWTALDKSAGTSWTYARILSEAALLLESKPVLWPFETPVIAAVPGHVDAVEARFLRAIPECTRSLVAARPVQKEHVERAARMLSLDPNGALLEAMSPAVEGGTDLGTLKSFLFESPEKAAGRKDRGGKGADGTVTMEEHAGIDAEIEAAADWVSMRILEGTPLEEIAVLSPALDPFAGMIAERLARLPWKDGHGGLPVHVAGGLPATGTAAGQRVLGIVRAIRSFLPVDQLAQILPWLRLKDENRGHLSFSEAMDLAYGLGTAGGCPTKPGGAREWKTRVEKVGELLAKRAGQARQQDEEAGEGKSRRGQREEEDFLRNLGDVRDAVHGLDLVACLVWPGQSKVESLVNIWSSLRDFLGKWALLPVGDMPILPILDGSLGALAEDAACSALAGDDAMAAIEDAIASLRLKVGRFGDPAVYVGTIEGAAGLGFESVKVLGLAEGQFPSLAHDDPLLPPEARGCLGDKALPGPAERALAQMQALDRVVRNTKKAIAFSVPREDMGRTSREPSTILLDVASALGWPGGRVAGADSPVPDLRSLSQHGFAPAREALDKFRSGTPLSQASWEDRVAAGNGDVPREWQSAPVFDLARMEGILLPEGPSAMDGILGAGAVMPTVPGLSPEHPISATKLKTLLECPHRFLLESILHWGEPSSHPSLLELESLEYGSLFHKVAQRFSESHGKEFGERKPSLPKWQEKARAIAGMCFDELMETRFLLNDTVRGQQRDRLYRDVERFIEYDWGKKPREFVAVEMGFGRPDGLEIGDAGRSLFVTGYIDRIDKEDGRTLVRDLKTGKPAPRTGKDSDPQPTTDVQIGLYSLVAGNLAREWKVPPKVACAYFFAKARAGNERAFRDDFDDLSAAVISWIGVAAALAREHSFPRTLVKKDCNWCPFKPVCGSGSLERAARILEEADGPVGLFRDMRTGE